MGIDTENHKELHETINKTISRNCKQCKRRDYHLCAYCISAFYSDYLKKNKMPIFQFESIRLRDSMKTFRPEKINDLSFPN